MVVETQNWWIGFLCCLTKKDLFFIIYLFIFLFFEEKGILNEGMFANLAPRCPDLRYKFYYFYHQLACIKFIAENFKYYVGYINSLAHLFITSLMLPIFSSCGRIPIRSI